MLHDGPERRAPRGRKEEYYIDARIVCVFNRNNRKEYHSLSYDDLTAHVTMVFVRCMLLDVLKRKEEDARTIGELFCLMVSKVVDITYQELMLILETAVLTALKEVFQISEEQLAALHLRNH